MAHPYKFPVTKAQKLVRTARPPLPPASATHGDGSPRRDRGSNNALGRICLLSPVRDRTTSRLCRRPLDSPNENIIKVRFDRVIYRLSGAREKFEKCHYRGRFVNFIRRTPRGPFGVRFMLRLSIFEDKWAVLRRGKNIPSLKHCNIVNSLGTTLRILITCLRLYLKKKAFSIVSHNAHIIFSIMEISCLSHLFEAIPLGDHNINVE